MRSGNCGYDARADGTVDCACACSYAVAAAVCRIAVILHAELIALHGVSGLAGQADAGGKQTEEEDEEWSAQH